MKLLKKSWKYGGWWSPEGFLWRRGDYIVFEQRGAVKPGYKRKWELRKVHGATGSQEGELEGSFWNEADAFKAGNKAVRKAKKA